MPSFTRGMWVKGSRVQWELHTQGTPRLGGDQRFGGVLEMLHAKGSPWCFTDGGLPSIPMGRGTLFSQSRGSVAEGVPSPGGPGPLGGGGSSDHGGGASPRPAAACASLAVLCLHRARSSRLPMPPPIKRGRGRRPGRGGGSGGGRQRPAPPPRPRPPGSPGSPAPCAPPCCCSPCSPCPPAPPAPSSPCPSGPTASRCPPGGRQVGPPSCTPFPSIPLSMHPRCMQPFFFQPVHPLFLHPRRAPLLCPPNSVPPPPRLPVPPFGPNNRVRTRRGGAGLCPHHRGCGRGVPAARR